MKEHTNNGAIEMAKYKFSRNNVGSPDFPIYVYEARVIETYRGDAFNKVRISKNSDGWWSMGILLSGTAKYNCIQYGFKTKKDAVEDFNYMAERGLY